MIPLRKILGNPLLEERFLRFHSEKVLRYKILKIEEIIYKITFLIFLEISAGLFLEFLSNYFQPQAFRNIGFSCGVIWLCLVLITVFFKSFSMFTAPLASIFSGFFIFGLAMFFEARFPGIAIQTLILTISALLIMTFFYLLNINFTKKLISIVVAVSSFIAVTYLFIFLIRFLNPNLLFIHQTNTGAIIWFGFISVLASLCFLIDFERIKNLTGKNLPDYMSWYLALSIIVTLVWLYLAILRLLVNLRRK